MTTLRQNLASLPREAWILFAGTFINRFGTFVHPFLILYLTGRGYSASAAGVALAGYGAGTVVSTLIGGYLADRIGRRHTIVLSMYSAAAVMLGLAAARSYPAIVAFSALAGLTAELYRPASSALLVDLVPAGQRVTAFAAYRLAVNAGFALGPAAAGLLATKSFTFLFVGDAITSVLFGTVALFALPHGVRSTAQQARWLPALRSAGRNTPFLRLLLATLLASAVLFQMGSTLPLHLKVLGYPAFVYGFLASLNGILIVAFELPLSSVTQKRNPRRVMALGFLLIGLGMAATGISSAIWALALTVMVWTLGEMISAPIGSAYVADLAPEELRGRYMGLFGLTWSLGLAIGPTAGAFLFDHEPAWIWILCAVAGIAAAGIVGEK